MNAGIEKIDLYAGRFCTDAVALAQARGRAREEAIGRVMVHERSVISPYEDAVTLAVNAACRLLTDADRQDIELLIVGTESGVDLGKPVASWVHRFCGLPANCRSFDVKHACYGGTGGLKMALAWVMSQARPGKKALVISADATRPAVMEFGCDFVGGGCAAALLVSVDPQVLELDLRRAGYWTNEIADTFRPTFKDEIGDNQLSLYSYLDGLDEAYLDYVRQVGELDYAGYFKNHIYHAPFPGMTRQAHQTMLARFGIVERQAVEASFVQRVLPGLGFARRIGSAYGASNFVCLMGLLSAAEAPPAGERISLFAYGSGCQAEFYEGSIGPAARQQGQSRGIEAHLNDRLPLSLADYEESEKRRADMVERRDGQPDTGQPPGAYQRQYAGRGLLVLRRIEGFRRFYEWS